MKNLSKDQDNRRNEISTALEEARQELDAQIEKFNKALEQAKDDLEAPLSTYNNALSDARELRDEVVGDIDNYISDRSEKWQEGERGEQYTDWKSEWEGLDFEAIEIDLPEEITIDAEEHHQLLLDAPDEPGSC